MRSLNPASTRRARTRVLALAVTAGLAGSLVACSSDDDDTAGATDTTTTSSATGGAASTDAAGTSSDAVTVTHAFGTTEIPADPAKIVSFSSAFTDAFSALGRPVDVSYVSDFYKDAAPWEKGDAVETVSYAMSATPDVEKIAGEDPDVIFAGYLPDQATYDRLNTIAPTVAVVGGSTQTDDWREATTVAGEVLGRQDTAKDLIADADAAVAATKEKYPSLDGATGAFGQISAQGLAVVTGDKDPANVFLTDLGVVIPENIRDASKDGSRAFISEENTDLLNTDLLLMWPVGIAEQDVPTTVKGWDQLTPVKDRTAFLADSTAARALGTPTILSVDWTLETLDPIFTALQEAAE